MRRSITMCRATTIAVITTTIITGGTAAITATGIKLNNDGRLARGARFTLPHILPCQRLSLSLARDKGNTPRKNS